MYAYVCVWNQSQEEAMRLGLEAVCGKLGSMVEQVEVKENLLEF